MEQLSNYELLDLFTSYTTISAALDIAAEIANRELNNATSLVATARTMSGTAGTLTLILNLLIQIVACLVSILFVLSYSAKAAQNHE